MFGNIRLRLRILRALSAVALVCYVIVVSYTWYEYSERGQSSQTQLGPGTVEPEVVDEGRETKITDSRPYTQRVLLQSEEIWSQAQLKRAAAIRKYGPIFQAEPWTLHNLLYFWNFFTPSFNCPVSVERIGKFGDGGKYVCGFSILAQKKSCLVYSFGVSDEVSFEKEILERSEHCVVRMYDHTVSKSNGVHQKLLVDYTTRAYFHKIGLAEHVSNSTVKTLMALMSENNDTFIDILKVDIEGGEFEALRTMIKEFQNLPQLPFGQLQIELHLPFLNNTNAFQTLYNWFDLLESNGLRAFYHEPNQIPLLLKYELILLYYEYSFLNFKTFNNSEYLMM